MSILSACAMASSSRTGATARQGPHQGAQKSTRTGLSFWRTSASKVASVVSLMAPTRGLLSVVLRLGKGSCGRSVGERGLVDERRVGGRCPGVVAVGQEALGVQGRRTARTGGGDRLPVGVVDQVAGSEDAGQV